MSNSMNDTIDKNHKHTRWNFHHLFFYHKLHYILMAAFVFIIAIAIIVVIIERNAPGSNLTIIGDGIWWAFVTVAAVGYGDHYPVTTVGRVLAIMLMFVGITLFSIITANVASLFVEEDEEKELDEIKANIKDLEKKIDQLIEKK